MSKYEDRNVEELKELARDRGLPVSGTKAELITRLRGEDSTDDEREIVPGDPNLPGDVGINLDAVHAEEAVEAVEAASEAAATPDMEVAAEAGEPGPVAEAAIAAGDVNYQGVPLPHVAQRKPTSVYHPSLTEPGTEPLGAPIPSLVKGDVPALLEAVRNAVNELQSYTRDNPGDGVLVHHVSGLASNLDSLDRAADLHRQMARPPGE